MDGCGVRSGLQFCEAQQFEGASSELGPHYSQVLCTQLGKVWLLCSSTSDSRSRSGLGCDSRSGSPDLVAQVLVRSSAFGA